MGIFELLVSNARWRNRWRATPAMSDLILPLVMVSGFGLSYVPPNGRARPPALPASPVVLAPVLGKIPVILGGPAQADFAVSDGETGNSLIPRVMISGNQVDAVIQDSYSGAALTVADVQSSQRPPPRTASSVLVTGNRFRSRAPAPVASAVFLAQCTVTGNVVTNEAVATGAVGNVPPVFPASLFVVNPDQIASIASALSGVTITGNVLVAPATLPSRPAAIPAPLNDWANFNTILPALTPPPTVPTVTGIFPPSGDTGGGTTLTITGSGFTEATSVAFGANPAEFTAISDTQITAVSPAGTPGAVHITVTTPAGTSAIGPADQFSYFVND